MLLGITRAISYGNFPEVRRANSARYEESQRRSWYRNRKIRKPPDACAT